MNIFVCTSRGAALQPFLAKKIKSPFKIYNYPGATLRTITFKTKQILANLDSASPCTFYIIAGLPDITKRIKNYYLGYEEVIFEGEPYKVSQKILRDIHHLADIIHLNNHKVVICPIVPSNIEKWNLCRLRQHHTHFLSYRNSYPDMQMKIHSTTLLINNEIVNFNAENSVTTPFIATLVIVTYKRNPSAIACNKFQYKHLPDGVHFNPTIANRIVNKIVKSIKSNSEYIVPSPKRKSEEELDGPSSPKRSWRS